MIFFNRAELKYALDKHRYDYYGSSCNGNGSIIHKSWSGTTASSKATGLHEGHCEVYSESRYCVDNGWKCWSTRSMSEENRKTSVSGRRFYYGSD